MVNKEKKTFGCLSSKATLSRSKSKREIIDLVQGSNRALKQTGDHNLDLERMQFKKDRGNVSKAKDYSIKRPKLMMSNLQWEKIRPT